MDSQVISCIVKKAIKQEANSDGLAKMKEVIYVIQAVPEFGWGESNGYLKMASAISLWMAWSITPFPIAVKIE